MDYVFCWNCDFFFVCGFIKTIVCTYLFSFIIDFFFLSQFIQNKMCVGQPTWAIVMPSCSLRYHVRLFFVPSTQSNLWHFFCDQTRFMYLLAFHFSFRYLPVVLIALCANCHFSAIYTIMQRYAVLLSHNDHMCKYILFKCNRFIEIS